MTDDLDGWELHDTSTIDVSHQDSNGIETQETKFYVKKINDEWYYKTKRRAKLNKYTIFKSIKENGGEYRGYIDCGWVDLND